MSNKSFHESRYFKTIESVGPDEYVMCEVYQHPFGLIFIYGATLVCLAAGLAIIILFSPSVAGNGSTAAYPFVALMSIIVILIVGVMLAMATVVYKQTKLTVTDHNIVQVVQKGMLMRKISQLSLANVEDVTSEQKGAFANMYNYGTLVIETAGEQANFNFNFCPNPHRVAKIILDAKDNFLSKTGQAGSYRNQVHLEQQQNDNNINNG